MREGADDLLVVVLGDVGVHFSCPCYFEDQVGVTDKRRECDGNHLVAHRRFHFANEARFCPEPDIAATCSRLVAMPVCVLTGKVTKPSSIRSRFAIRAPDGPMAYRRTSSARAFQGSCESFFMALLYRASARANRSQSKRSRGTEAAIPNDLSSFQHCSAHAASRPNLRNPCSSWH